MGRCAWALQPGKLCVWAPAFAGVTVGFNGLLVFKRNGGAMDNNPSHGNKVGGLTTILEKSLGAVAKGGSTGLMDVVQ